MKISRITAAVVSVTAAIAGVLAIGAGSASAATGQTYCYRNANNDNGTRINLTYDYSPVTDGVRATLQFNYENWNGSFYVPTNNGGSLVGLFIPTSAPNARALCLTANPAFGIPG
ncbi:hypothetical protein [Williamsia sp. CHRR-6]|uniref:hypothetical protein n=1 Tax=Williamsia sp. CHRR-6 TaxID=2835871 RepID=UPI001BDA2B46|nr:hypothetical protein [Williamsia sp. CHRR-6]MBT0567710.1 hypothetical protein [Williamsia sp. CHRR-6]